ncbi:cell division protein FtsA [Virgibacillus oceani]|uniref:Cell division protein FtsA n=1 Tax=Virgibacillus oceani TaxID=1479511 RepID=A0A917HP28_9BACI|nr:cell division protein FtsA [Virgibacillus oceani]GGG85025.1 cell division protein FtsA [Virgibacillus oceani]
MEERVFALDIGTRSVTGIILEKQNDRFSIVDYYTQEHKARSMVDGQIHNVVAVAEVIQEVKAVLENTYGELKSVCVAAAGRALKTIQAEASIDLKQQPIMENDSIKHLELSAVQTAQLELASEEQKNDYSNYYCVGYSVLHYKLDGELIGSLIDQSGEKATAEIIATFLPKVVVESLLAALSRANLEMEALTLEPIAAIHVLIPESMRRLNVALVDIGAGTSDIAITDKGTIVAYGMVPIAGDEITEAISEQYLLDFPEAEQTKRTIVETKAATVQDILGFENAISYETLVHDISISIEKLADAIAEEIIALNSKPPKAVMLVGGGSLTPELTKMTARKLQLPENRVAIRGIEAIQNLTITDNLPNGPEYVTPIGIAISAKQNPVQYVSVKVNEKVIRMFEMKQLTVGDCFVQAKIEANKLYGKPGIAAIITVNDKEITLPGGYGKAPKITLNNRKASVDSEIHNGDVISIEKGTDGEDPSITIDQLIGETPSFTINFNSKPVSVKPLIYVNDVQKEKDYVIKDNDSIVIRQPKTIQDFLTLVSSEKLHTMKPYIVYVNNKEMKIDNGETSINLNNKEASLSHPLKHGDHLTISNAAKLSAQDLLDKSNQTYWDSITVAFNQKPVTIKQQRINIIRNQTEIKPDTIIQPNDRIEVREKKQDSFIFQDVFRYIDLDLANANGKFHLYKNKQPATFYEPIQHGDSLEINWETP